MDFEVCHDPSEIVQLHLLLALVKSFVLKRKFRLKNALFLLKIPENRRALGALPPDPLHLF